jgi:hypothetical protein
MSRKSIIQSYKVIDAGAMASNITSTVQDCRQIDNIGLMASWSGTAPIGVLTVEVSNDQSTWSALDFGAPINVSGASGNHNININQIPFVWMRVVYTASSGTGVLNCHLAAKVVGA